MRIDVRKVQRTKLHERIPALEVEHIGLEETIKILYPKRFETRCCAGTVVPRLDRGIQFEHLNQMKTRIHKI